MLLIIENAVKEFLKGSGLPALEDVKEYRHIDISSRQRWTRGTVVDVVVTGGNHTPYNNEIRQNLNVSVVVVTEAPRSADERNKRLYPVLQGILHLLSGEDLELDIAPLIPGAFRDISFDDLTSIGAIAWQIDFTTDYTLETVSKEDAEEMIELGVSYSFGGSDTIRESSDIYKVKDIYTVEDLYV